MNLDLPIVWPTQDAEVLALLRDLQANIVKAHGRERAHHWFFRFPEGARRPEITDFLRSMRSSLSNALTHLEDARVYRNSGGFVSGSSVVTFSLSAAGLSALGIPAHLLPGVECEAFHRGQYARAGHLGDRNPDACWETHLRSPHALLMIAGDSPEEIARTRAQVLDQYDVQHYIVGEELGCKLYDRPGESARNTVEHFGFADGLSNPLPVVGPGEYTSQSPYGPAMALKRVLIRAPGLGGAAFGSFFVLRKLEQNVRRFWTEEARLAQALGLNAADAPRAGAMIMGRFRDGTLLAMSAAPGGDTAPSNDFTYWHLDRDGRKCPFQAHIRRANPRGDTVARHGLRLDEDETRHRIVRRGITYGARTDDVMSATPLAEKPEAGVGLLFMCCQSSIEDQFEFVQREWLSAEHSPAEQDAVMGPLDRVPQMWPTQYGSWSMHPAQVSDCITLKGGEYFYAPPVSFFSAI